MATMTALSVKAPWSRRIRDREKSIECRTWGTPYRGPLLICSSKRYDKYDLMPGEDPGPLGMALCVADLADCRPMRDTPADEEAAQCMYSHGTIAWVLANVRPLKEPFPVKGQLGLFKIEVPEGVLP